MSERTETAGSTPRTAEPGRRRDVRRGVRPRRTAWFLSLAAAAGFAVVAALVGSGTTAGLDDALLHAAAGRRGALEVVASELTALGNISAVFALALVCAAFLWPTPGRRLGGWLILLALVAWAAPEILKAIVGRPRPAAEMWATRVRSPSFPSGHALQSALVWGAAAVAVRRTVGGGIGRAALAVGAILPLLIGASRTVLGVHFPTDVVAGWLAGWALLGVAIALAPRHDGTGARR